MKDRTIVATLCAAFCINAGANSQLVSYVEPASVLIEAPAGLLNAAMKLYLVWDASEDKGERLEAWDADKRIAFSGTLSSARATYTFDRTAIPQGAHFRAIAVDEVRLIDGWVKLGEGQWLDTGVLDTAAYSTEFKFRPTGTSSPVGQSWCSLMGSNRDQFTVGGNKWSRVTYYLRLQNKDSAGGNAFTLPDTTQPHTVRIADKNVYLDGTSTTSAYPSGALGNSKSIILVGTSNNQASNNRQVHAEWHFVRFMDANGDALIDLVPALRGTESSQEAVFYDAVSGKCFASAGTGSSTLEYDTSASVTNTLQFSVTSSAADSIAAQAYDLYATWTGKGETDNLSDPLNWSCKNAQGEAVENAIPTAQSVAIFSGEFAVNIPNGADFQCKRIELRDASLAKDCDWQGVLSANFLQSCDMPSGTWFDTGFYPDSNTRVVMDVTVRNNKEYWFGEFGIMYNDNAFAVGNDGGNIYSGFGSDAGGKGKVAANGRHIIDFNKGVLTIDNETHTEREGTFDRLPRSIYLFAQNRQNEVKWQNAILFHSCQIYDDGTLVHNYIPAKQDGAIYLYDLVEKKYIARGGTTALPSVRSVSGQIDLAGKKLHLASLEGNFDVTDATGGGELHVHAETGVLVANDSVGISGGVKLVKEGTGAFLAAKSGQTYTGGTLVREGLAQSGAYNQPFGAEKSLITVISGAAYDFNGMAAINTSFTPYRFNIAGDGIDGSGAIYCSKLIDQTSWWTLEMIADLELSSSASIVVKPISPIVMGTGAILKLNNNTLTCLIGNSQFSWRGTTVPTGDTGTILCKPLEGAGTRTFLTFLNSRSDLGDATLEMDAGNCTISSEVTASVGTLILRYAARNVYDRAKHATIIVRNCYRPETPDLLKNITLGDATHLAPILDLSALSSTFALGTARTLGVATGATVGIKFGSRNVAKDAPFLSWETEPASFSSCTFTCADEQPRYRIEKRTDGLYAIPSTGTVVCLF